MSLRPVSHTAYVTRCVSVDVGRCVTNDVALTRRATSRTTLPVRTPALRLYLTRGPGGGGGAAQCCYCVDKTDKSQLRREQLSSAEPCEKHADQQRLFHGTSVALRMHTWLQVTRTRLHAILCKVKRKSDPAFGIVF